MRSVRLLAFVLALAVAPAASEAGESLIENSSFASEGGGLPTGWTSSEGARTSPLETLTQITALEGGGVALAGNAQTARWTMLSQRFAAQPGTCFELSFRARATGLKLDGAQFGSSYVGFVLRAADGAVQRFVIRDVRADTWQDERVYTRMPADAATIEVALFLSQTGRLEVRAATVRKLAPEDSYDALVADMDRNYSFFAPHGIDWQALAAKHAPAGHAAGTPASFAAAVRPLLAALEDGHVWIDVPGARRKQPWSPPVKPNFEIEQVLQRLASRTQVIRNVLAGRTKDGYGYLALGTMQGTPAQFRAVDAAWRGLFDAPAIILDLRVNGGGQESWGQQLCGYLAQTRLLYGRAKIRSGPRYDDLAPGGERRLVPRTDLTYRKPVVALIGPACISSGEGLAMMLKALPDVQLVGLPTAGSSGNPQPLHLPNGVTVWYSRWISLQPDGTPLERTGVPPDVRVEYAAGGDAAFDKALELLKARRQTSGKAPK